MALINYTLVITSILTPDIKSTVKESTCIIKININFIIKITILSLILIIKLKKLKVVITADVRNNYV